VSARRRRRDAGGEEGEANEERWMASYMDMVTVLMCMFIVLFAMSTVDQKKFDELRNSLATGFGVVKSQKVDTASGKVVPADSVDEVTPKKPSDLELAKQEAEDLTALRERLRSSLTQQGLQQDVSFRIDQRGLTIGLVGSETFFDSNQAVLTAEAGRVLDAIGPILAAETYHVSVEGHADHRLSGPPFPTNWELAAGRATAVLRHLVESNGFADTRISAVSFGSSHPLAEGTDPAALATNRRVDIVVLSSQPERVRDLIPQTLPVQTGAG
jgi:chemotaxis protein MotB